MKKSNLGYLLLALLVLTGLAGIVTRTSLTNGERKTAIAALRGTFTDLQHTVEGLSDAQLDFRPSGNQWSIRECIEHLALAEPALWQTLANSMKSPVVLPEEMQVRLSDEELAVCMVEGDCISDWETTITFSPTRVTKFPSVAGALASIADTRQAHLRYIKTTTEDLHNHLIPLRDRTADSYQWLLLISAHTSLHRQQIQEILNHPDFPKS